MSLSEVFNILKAAGQAQPNIHTIEDDFLKLNREDIVYSAFIIQEREHQRVGEFINYSFYIGYVDRLTDDKSNEIDIHSTGLNILNNIVNGIKDKFYPTIDITAGRFITFNQRFTAECAGVYTDIILSVPTSDCPDFDFHISGSDLRPATFKSNGVYEPVGFDGYSKVSVEVEGGGVSEEWVKNYTYSKGDTDKKITVVRGEIPTKVSQLTNDKGYLTKHQTLKTINGETIVGEGNIEITGSLTPEQEAKIAEIDNKADKSEIPSLVGYATEEWVEGKGYLTEHQDISNLATKDELSEVEGKIPSLTGYATENYVQEIDGARKQWVIDQGYLTEHQSLEGYATESWVEGKGYLTEHQHLKTINGETIVGEGNIEITGSLTPEQEAKIAEIDNKADKSEIPSLVGYATQSWVESKGYITEIPNDYIKRSEIDDHWNIECTTTDKSIKAKLDFTPSSTNDNKNFASLGTVRNFYNDTIHKGDVWTGTQAQWDALTATQKASYTIALITE